MSVYYVGVGGSDANAGTSWALRKLTLNGAEDIPVAAGDEVVVGPGTYRELLTVDVSGTAGNVITYTADYTGARTSGLKGIVRITGSADDIARTRANCITGTSKDYRTFRGFLLDLVSNKVVSMTTCANWTIDECYIAAYGGANGVDMNHLSTNVVISNCFMQGCQYGIYAGFTAADNSGHVFENCIINSGGIGYYGTGIFMDGVGGATTRNCTVLNAAIAGIWGRSLNVGQVVTVNNCIVAFCGNGLQSDSTARFTEDYNTLFANAAARSNVTAGANSVTRPALFDTRWFFEAVNGGRMVTPFDLASYSTLVEYNSGTGAPSTDMRGASAVGTYREWGTLEYDANYRIGGPVSIAPIGGIG